MAVFIFKKPVKNLTMKKIFRQNNTKLLRLLIPNKSIPVYGNSFTNPKDEIFNNPIKQN